MVYGAIRLRRPSIGKQVGEAEKKRLVLRRGSLVLRVTNHDEPRYTRDARWNR